MNAAPTLAPTRRFQAHPGWHVLGCALVAGWLSVLTAMFWPVDEGGGAVELGTRALGGALVDDESWMGAYLGGRKLGFLHARITRVEDGTQLFQESQLQLTVAGLAQRVETRLTARLDLEQRLERFDFELRAGPVGMRVAGRMLAEGLELKIDIGGEGGRRLLPVDEPPLLDLTLPYLLARQNLAPGARYRVAVFDPRSLSNQPSLVEVIGPEAVKIEGRLVPATRLQRSSSGLQIDSWMDADGRLLKEQLEGGLVLLREDAERARNNIVGLKAGEADRAAQDWMRALLPGARLPAPVEGTP